jgi:hypothetical protein
MIHSHLVNTSKFYGLMYFVLTPENAQIIQLIYDHSCDAKCHSLLNFVSKTNKQTNTFFTVNQDAPKDRKIDNDS